MNRAPVLAVLLEFFMLSVVVSTITVPDIVPPPAFDKPGSGVRTQPDLTSVFLPVSIGNPKQTYTVTPLILLNEIPFFTRFDTDANKVLNETEMSVLFSDLDKNDDNSLDKQELSQLNMQVLFCAGNSDGDTVLSEQELDDLLLSMDLNGNDSLYVGELYAYLKYTECL